LPYLHFKTTRNPLLIAFVQLTGNWLANEFNGSIGIQSNTAANALFSDSGLCFSTFVSFSTFYFAVVVSVAFALLLELSF